MLILLYQLWIIKQLLLPKLTYDLTIKLYRNIKYTIISSTENKIKCVCFQIKYHMKLPFSTYTQIPMFITIKYILLSLISFMYKHCMDIKVYLRYLLLLRTKLVINIDLYRTPTIPLSAFIKPNELFYLTTFSH